MHQLTLAERLHQLLDLVRSLEGSVSTELVSPEDISFTFSFPPTARTRSVLYNTFGEEINPVLNSVPEGSKRQLQFIYDIHLADDGVLRPEHAKRFNRE